MFDLSLSSKIKTERTTAYDMFSWVSGVVGGADAG